MSLDVWLTAVRPTDVFDYNITHNLGPMAFAAGIKSELWSPEEIGITKAAQLIDPLSVGLGKLKRSPEYYKTFNPSNGWGDYDGFVEFVEAYLKACVDNPDADIHVSR